MNNSGVYILFIIIFLNMIIESYIAKKRFLEIVEQMKSVRTECARGYKDE